VVWSSGKKKHRDNFTFHHCHHRTQHCTSFRASL